VGLQVEGSFNAQDAVRICDSDGREVGRALVNYSASDICKVQVRAW
jgi:glutamate 5-kinase